MTPSLSSLSLPKSNSSMADLIGSSSFSFTGDLWESYAAIRPLSLSSWGGHLESLYGSLNSSASRANPQSGGEVWSPLSQDFINRNYSQLSSHGHPLSVGYLLSRRLGKWVLLGMGHRLSSLDGKTFWLVRGHRHDGCPYLLRIENGIASLLSFSLLIFF